MSTSPGRIMHGPPPAAESMWQAGMRGNLVDPAPRSSLNWLALGLLLAAWNASDDAQELAARATAGCVARLFVRLGARGDSACASNCPATFFPKVTKASTYCKARYL